MIDFFPDPYKEVMILFDDIMYNPNIIDSLTRGEEIMYKELLSFIRGRIMPLRQDMIREQTLATDKLCGILFKMAPQNGEPKMIAYYSLGLASKIRDSFTDADFDYVYRKIDGLL
ncbi:MAG: hypothetical protein QM802_11765 [Agriterribacter sp.]